MSLDKLVGSLGIDKIYTLCSYDFQMKTKNVNDGFTVDII